MERAHHQEYFYNHATFEVTFMQPAVVGKVTSPIKSTVRRIIVLQPAMALVRSLLFWRFWETSKAEGLWSLLFILAADYALEAIFFAAVMVFAVLNRVCMHLAMDFYRWLCDLLAAVLGDLLQMLQERLTEVVLDAGCELSTIRGHSQEDEDLCAICLEPLRPLEPLVPHILRGQRTRTALERLRPHVRAATSALKHRAVLVRLGTCQHMFHKQCFQELATHNSCPTRMQCPTCRADLVQTQWRGPLFLRRLVEFLHLRLDFDLVSSLFVIALFLQVIIYALVLDGDLVYSLDTSGVFFRARALWGTWALSLSLVLAVLVGVVSVFFVLGVVLGAGLGLGPVPV